MQSATTSPQLYELTRPLPAKFIKAAPQGKHGSYIPHWVIAQVILATVGPYDWQLVEILRSDLPEYTTRDGKTTYPGLENAIVGSVHRLTLTIDNREVTIEEVGSVEAAAFEDNDGERLKKSASDALKRCAMRLGIGIHLWCKEPEEFIITASLKRADGQEPAVEETVVNVEETDHDG